MSANHLSPCPEQLAMACVPKQEWCQPYELDQALREGTIFPCLNLPFYKAPAADGGLPAHSDSPEPGQQDRERSMTRLAEVSFAVNDLTLYLDTHPDCPDGLALFYQLMEERLGLLSGFAGSHYPLTQSSMITGNCDRSQYGWQEGPMPWEGGCI